MRSIAILALFATLLFPPFEARRIAGQNRQNQRGTASQEIVGKKRVTSKEGLIVRLQKIIPQLMKEGEVPGLSIVLIRDAKVFWHQSFGVSNADTKERINDNTVFEAASLSKPVFAYAALKLVDSGVLELDKPLATYLPEAYVQNDERINLITARMVLDHTTGFQNEATPGRPLKIYFTPGEKFSYSGEGFLYLQKVVERITGEPLDSFMKSAVFEPLGMTSSSFIWQTKYKTLKANGHKPSGAVAQKRRPTVARSYSGLHTTSLDYAKFVIAVINGTGLKKEPAEQMVKGQVRLDETCFSCIERSSGSLSQTLSWGLGWGLERTQIGDAIWHWGDNNSEFQNFVMAYPKEKTGIVIFTNSGNGISITPAIVAQALAGDHPVFRWMGYEPYNSPRKILFRKILARGETAINQYRRQARNSSGGHLLNQDQVNGLAYWLLARKRVREAIELFEMNVEDYPNSSNAYDSLGEAYMVAGNKAEAIKNYQRSLVLDPGNDNARQMIQKLERH
jgi:CubicO group peptidase (beta-lactamase class C family)